jgi:hypothetical protein
MSSNYIDFTVNGTVDTERIYYEVYIVPKNTSTMTSNNINNYLKTYLTDQNDVMISDSKIYKNLRDSQKSDGKVLYQAVIEPNTNGIVKNETRNFRLRLWISDEYQTNQTETLEFSIYLYAMNVDNEFEIPPYADGKVRNAINAKINAETNSCNPIWVDDMGTQDETDDITYFSGANDCVDMNYVWYSGRLWRIVAIYPDRTMKMVTEDVLTTINWGSTVEYNGSWIYQWVNEDFYDTLVRPNDIIVGNTWNYSTDGNSTPVRPESIATQKTVFAPVGLLNAYEYYNAYRNATTSTNYLNIGYYWWHITPYSDSTVRFADNNGGVSNSSPASNSRGVRPAVYLKSDVDFTGSGTKNDPYKIVGDKESPSSGTLISSRSVGEYVKFDNDIYRIVSIDENLGTTKLTRVDYLRDNGTVMSKYFASTAYYGSSTNTQTNDYWDYYLNNTWYGNISNTYKSMLVDGTYYLGFYEPAGKNYKITICKDTESALDTITTKNCTKYTSSDTNKTFEGKVGLPRVGEMFSSQLGTGSSSSSYYLTLTPYSTTYVRRVYQNGTLGSSAASSEAFSVRPSITLKSGIRITGGIGYVGGDVNSPFEISE